MVIREMKNMNNTYGIMRNKTGEIHFKQNQKHLFYEKNKFYGFKNITEERNKEIKANAQFWVSHNQEISFQERLYSIYFMLNSRDNPYKIVANDECYLFLIHAFDPELKLLQISFKESKKEEIKRRFQEEFNTYYDSRLLQIEQYYNKRFPTIIDEFDKKM